MLSVRPSPFSKKYKDICPAPIAVIDIGTNTIRFLVGCVKEGKIIRIAMDRAVTRLGKDLQKTAKLNQNNIEKSKRFILKLKELCEFYGVQEIIAIGTSALREGKNSKEFLDDIKEIAGIDIEIISGEKEAELTLKGVLASGVEEYQTYFIVDIGGGSTEWIFCPDLRNHQSAVYNLKIGSIPIGAVRLSETFIKHDPPTPDELHDMKDYVFSEFSSSLPSLFPNIHLFLNQCPMSLIATGGTITTLAQIDMEMDAYNGDKIHLHKISLPTLETIYKRLITLPYDERSKIKGLEPERADIIVPGTLILLAIMEILNIKEVIVSDYGLLEGALISYNNQL